MFSRSLRWAKKHLEVTTLKRFPSSEDPGLPLDPLGNVLTGIDPLSSERSYPPGLGFLPLAGKTAGSQNPNTSP